MAAPDRSWTIAPALLWFCAVLVVALCVLDGDLHALADRLTTKREAATPAPAGPVLASPLVLRELAHPKVVPFIYFQF